MNDDLKEFSDDVCEAIDRARDWQDVEYFVGEQIYIHSPWVWGNVKEIQSAIRMAIRNSSNKNVKEGRNKALLDYIWDSVESDKRYISWLQQQETESA